MCIMACNGVRTPPAKITPPKSVTLPVLKFFNPLPVLKLFTPPSNWKKNMNM